MAQRTQGGERRREKGLESNWKDKGLFHDEKMGLSYSEPRTQQLADRHYKVV
jgi:hypothetical protein